MLKRRRLFSDDKLAVMHKPQYKILAEVKGDVEKLFCKWLVEEFDLRGYQASPISEEVMERVISAREKVIAPSAPDVFLAKKDVIDSLLIDAQNLLEEMNKSGEVDKILDAQARREENEEYGT